MTDVLRRVGMSLLAPVAAIVAAMIITSVLIAVSGESVGDFLSVIISVPQHRLVVNMINQSALIYMSGLAAAIGFRMNLFNIGVEGQYRVASYGAAALAGAAIFPGPLNVIIPILFAVVLGAAWAGIAGLLKVTRGVSEVISTIMLNAIAITSDRLPARQERTACRQRVRTTPIPASSHVGGWYPFAHTDGPVWTLSILAVLLGVGFWVLLNKTRFGFDLRATGGPRPPQSPSGVNVGRMVVSAMLLSGAIAGLIWMPGVLSARALIRHDLPGRARLHRHRRRAARSQPAGRHHLRRGAVRLPQRAVQPAAVRDRRVLNVVQITQGIIVLGRHGVRGRTSLPHPAGAEPRRRDVGREPTIRRMPEGAPA